MPHPPFSFEPDGAPLESALPAALADGNHWRVIARAMNVDETYEAGYAKAVQYLDRRLREIVKRIVSRTDGRQTIVYLQGDHGPGSRLNWEDPGQTDYRERLGILLGVHFPTAPAIPVYASITPVNAMRLVVNSALGTTLPLLDDRSFFSRWSAPTEFIDVTDAIK